MVRGIAAARSPGQPRRPVSSVGIGPADGPLRMATARIPAIVSMPLPMMPMTNVAVVVI